MMTKFKFKALFILSITCQLIFVSGFARVPQKTTYLLVVRNGSDQLVISQPVGIRLTILRGGEKGEALYVETQTPVTDLSGTVLLEVGAGTFISGDLETVSSVIEPCFLKTEIDPVGGTNFAIVRTGQFYKKPFTAIEGEYATASVDTIFLADNRSGWGANFSDFENIIDRNEHKKRNGAEINMVVVPSVSKVIVTPPFAPSLTSK
jgi:hypothetical protein